MLIAPMIRAGVVLSQPPISTTPSTGWERSSSSVSIARKLRYIMLEGLVICSPTLIAGSSTGKPPACQTPRFTSSARWRMWEWQVLVSDQVLTMAITGLPAKSSRAKPISMVRDRWPKARMLSTPYQRWERRSCGLLRVAEDMSGVSPVLARRCHAWYTGTRRYNIFISVTVKAT
jgi:hypothetical protein